MNTILKTSFFVSGLIILLANLYACNEGRFKQGETLYEYHCASCHMDDGTGLASLYPPLNGSDFLMNNMNQLPFIMRYGMQGPLKVNGIEYTIPMSGIPELSAVEISNITNYIATAWTNKLERMSFEDVMKSLEQ